MHARTTHTVSQDPVVSITVGMKDEEEEEGEVRQDDEIVEFSLRQFERTQEQDHR